MNGFLVFLTLVVSAAASLGYHYPLPGMYMTGHELVITADRYCDCRAVRPVDDIEYSTRKIDEWRTGITFDEPGIVTGLETFCLHSIYEDAPDRLAVDWMIR